MDLEQIIRSIGYTGVAFVIFAESGLLFGFFFPGDSLLFTSGFLASQGVFDVKILIPLLFLCAVGGDTAGYWFGKKVGKKLFQREDSLFFHKRNLLAAQDFYKRHGGKTIILARFIPAVRTFAPIVAGIGDMEYGKFLSFNVIGGFLWAVGLGLAGFYLGKSIPNVDRYILPIVAIIVLLSVLPALIHMGKDKEQRDGIVLAVKGLFNNWKKSWAKKK